MRRILLGLSLCLALAISSGPALAWGDRGHSIVAELAQRHLTPKAADAVRELLAGASMAGVASWADDYKFRPEGSSTQAWHFIDIDVAKATYSEDDCKGACLVSALRLESAILSDPHRHEAEHRQALMMLIHLVGDSTQPFHCAERDNDSGANLVPVTLAINGPDGKPLPVVQTNLHAIWDDALINAHVYSWGVYADDLETRLFAGLPAPTIYGDWAATWVDECHVVAQRLYKMTPAPAAGASVNIGTDYQKAVQQTIDLQLATGGARLAALLNHLLGE
ncbi:S1/P1 nuclease [Labrys okinawensis]|uniref:S1/P1 nuclease n=1 Tax=Labrys okinawensis TaxID=346911 RepID=UPI0039BD7920